ncbi:unnamed protein product [Meganyctiphanes norvegica]|uniref:Condensation domain-containing protein n=1 Tax=Meganyctiphanes norvegica TaxID=48144 RepID=A0AAV2QLB1_MEGNR
MAQIQSTSRRLWQLLRMRPSVTTARSVLKRNVTTAHAVPLLNAGYDLESPHYLFGSQSWEWLRPATSPESEIDDWNRHHTRFVLPYLTINTDREITEEMWKQTLLHLRNQIPGLRMVILPRNNEKWICHINDMDIHLKMHENVAPLDIIEEMFDEGLDKAPFVCRVIKANREDAFPIPDDKESKPYQYYIFFYGHHGFIDGTTGALVTRFAIDNLNAVLAGKHIDDRVQLCQARKGDEIIAKKVKLKESLKNDPEWFQIEKERLLSTFKTPLLNEAFPAPNVSTTKTLNLIRTGNPVVLKAFYKQCKSAGVSITNGLVAAVNTAIVEMVRDAGIVRDHYHLTLNTNVDLRRYMNISPQTATGMFVGAMHQSMHPTKNVREEFWEHAKFIHKESVALLKGDGALIESVIREMAIPRVDPDEVFNSTKSTIYQRDYTFNNLMDITPVFYDPKRHKHAVITNFIATQALHNFNPMMFSFVTYRGVTQFTLSYATNFMTQETAEELMDRTELIVRDKAKIMS